MELIFKQPERRVDPRDPKTNPAYHKMLAKAELGKANLKFENEAEERDYRRNIEANPNNVYGLPAFYPALKIKPLYTGDLPSMTEEDWKKMETEQKRIESIIDVDLLCDRCGNVTSHSLSPDQTFCHDCGRQRPDYCTQYEQLKGARS